MLPEEAMQAFQKFCGSDLTETLALIEQSLCGVSKEDLEYALAPAATSRDAFAAANALKVLVSQLNVVIHAVGLLVCLPGLLEPGEVVDYVSLGAGNTGRPFDLETDRRIAEFKFIRWQGGPETIRQNGLFKDFFLLAEHETPKKKYLYVLDTKYPLKFFGSRRSLDSVLSRDVRLKQTFAAKYSNQCAVVRDYYQLRQHEVSVQDVSRWLPGLSLTDESK